MKRQIKFKATKLIFQCTPEVPDNETIQDALNCTITADEIEVRSRDYLLAEQVAWVSAEQHRQWEQDNLGGKR